MEEKENEGLLFGESSQNNKDFDALDEQEYELELVNVEHRNAKTTGRRQLSFKFLIRKDVVQKNAGRYVWYTISEKDGDKAFNWFRINQLIESQKGTEGYRERFEVLDEVLQYLIGRHYLAYVTAEEGNNGNVFNSIEGDSFTRSKWDSTPHPNTTGDTQPAQPATKGGADPKVAASMQDEGLVEGHNLDGLDLPDDDLPF